MYEELIKRLYEQARLLEGSINVRSMELLREAADALSRPAPAAQVPVPEVNESDLTDIVREAMQTEDYYNFPADFASYCVRRYVNAMRDDLLAAVPTPAPVATEAVAQGGGVDAERAEIIASLHGIAEFVGSPIAGGRGKWKRHALTAAALLASAPAVPFRPGITGPMRQAMIREDGSVWERVAEFEWRPYAPAVPVGDGWIAVGDRLPDEDMLVLCYWEDSGKMDVCYQHNTFWQCFPPTMPEPDYWCALPPAPASPAATNEQESK